MWIRGSFGVSWGGGSKKKRFELKYTQEQAAELLEIDPVYYGRIERGEKCLSVVKIVLAHERMEIDPLYLMTGDKRKYLITGDLLNRCPAEKLIEDAICLALK